MERIKDIIGKPVYFVKNSRYRFHDREVVNYDAVDVDLADQDVRVLLLCDSVGTTCVCDEIVYLDEEKFVYIRDRLRSVKHLIPVGSILCRNLMVLERNLYVIISAFMDHGAGHVQEP
jgi:hypothetical protein